MRFARSSRRRVGFGIVLSALALLAAGAGRAGSPAAAPATDPRLFAPPTAREAEPTGFACSVETLVSGADCVLESEAPLAADPAAQAKENAAIAAAMASWACSTAARDPLEPAADPAVKASCERAFREKALVCGVDGTRPLLDPRGRFAPEARLCYATLGEALAQARTAASVSAPCCRCLAAARCAGADGCNQALLSGRVDATTVACARKTCLDACRTFIADPPPPPGPTVEAPAIPPGPPMCRDPLLWDRRCDRI